MFHYDRYPKYESQLLSVIAMLTAFLIFIFLTMRQQSDIQKKFAESSKITQQAIERNEHVQSEILKK